MAGLGDHTNLVLIISEDPAPSPWRWPCPHCSQKALAVLLMMGFLCSLTFWSLLNPYFGLMRSLFLAFEYGLLYLLTLRLKYFSAFSCVWCGKCGVSLCSICHLEQKVQVQILLFWCRQVPENLHFPAGHSDKGLVTLSYPKNRLSQELNLKAPCVCRDSSLQLSSWWLSLPC